MDYRLIQGDASVINVFALNLRSSKQFVNVLKPNFISPLKAFTRMSYISDKRSLKKARAMSPLQRFQKCMCKCGFLYSI